MSATATMTFAAWLTPVLAVVVMLRLSAACGHRFL
jgi:hypothetical protein